MVHEAALVLPAPAKLNRFLHVVGRRADGYHLLQTAFQFIDLSDEIVLSARSDRAIVRTEGPNDVDPEADLAVRAAQALRDAVGGTQGVNIAVRKRIPQGGGLGGGSSDAATVLLGLNRLWGAHRDLDTLARIGLALGADVPVFVHGENALGEGVGERLTPLRLPADWFVVVDPGVRVPTASVFQAPELTRNSPPTTIPRLLAGELTRNDLEPAVRARFPSVAAALDWLDTHASARLTGSGGCVFAACATEDQARAIAAQCPPRWQAWAVRALSCSPVHAALQRHAST
jgi:4-diphosphocytidyl-2-C-methyl-D-erythritol kinase